MEPKSHPSQNLFCTFKDDSKTFQNYSCKLTSTGTKIQEYIDEIALITFFSDSMLVCKIKRKKQTTFPTHPTLEFTIASQFILNCESQQLSHNCYLQGNTTNKMNAREFKIRLNISFDSS